MSGHHVNHLGPHSNTIHSFIHNANQEKTTGLGKVLISLFSIFFVWIFFSIIYTGLILSDKTGIQKHYKYCCIASALFFLRPEAIFLLLAGFFVSFLRRELKSTVIYLIVMIILFISVEIIDTALGSPLHGAGRLRAIVSSHNAYELLFWGLEINFNPKALYYFIAISPFFACLTFCLFFDRAKCKKKS